MIGILFTIGIVFLAVPVDSLARIVAGTIGLIFISTALIVLIKENNENSNTE